jgi:DNA adenine methylase
MSKSIVKWAGGKSGLLPLIRQKMELISTKEATLYDLFGGGGSVSFEFVSMFKKVVLNDTNKELINLYTVVKNKPKELMKKLNSHKNRHNKEYYYKIRKKDRSSSYDDMEDVDKAARMLYLNKTCYNGLYRVNTKGQFNVPIGSQNSIKLYDEDLLMDIHYKLQKITLKNEDFMDVLGDCEKGDVVYVDPPYDRINRQSFIEYNGQRFGSEDQKRLAKKVDELTKKGVYVIFSNSATENIKELYKLHIDEKSIIKARRSIAADGTARAPIDEILGDNFRGVERV